MCQEQNMDIFQVFIDLNKAYDSVNRALQQKIFDKLKCPDHFVPIIKLLNDGMEAWANVGSGMAASAPVENGVKQGGILV